MRNTASRPGGDNADAGSFDKPPKIAAQPQNARVGLGSYGPRAFVSKHRLRPANKGATRFPQRHYRLCHRQRARM
jgi:hypothetical protein